MTSEFTSDFFRNNRTRLRALFGRSAPIVIGASGLLQRNGDNTYPFRQDSNFWYLTGVNVADAILVMDQDKEYIIVPDQQVHQTIFDGPILQEVLTARSGVDTILSEKEGWSRLSKRLKQAKQVATLVAPEAYLEFYGFYTNPARAALQEKIKAANTELEVLDVRQQLASLRMVKQPPELATIKKAITITINTLEEVRARLGSYGFEYEIEADLTQSYRKKGAKGHAFHPIVAAGLNACTIHYTTNGDSLSDTRFVLLDTGAEVDEYAADLGSTYWLTEKNSRETAIYEAVLAVQAFAYGVLKPGVLIREYEKQIEQYMGEKLSELGLIQSIERETVRKYFPHATSHHVGLDAHDAADYEQPLQPGMVLAVEPGIYIPEEKTGIRIENNVLITESGIEILSQGLVQ
ncbi:MAG TPA: Xaa-Pro peptidase family protein [Candidatus Limnocylindrales bacterium]|nr:Xaa-Pro peptidase family protein [Candidatus Limnocylindrales bacterium]